MKEFVPGKHLTDPICTLKRGTAPEQKVDLDEFEKQLDQNAQKIVTDDLDIEELYGDSQFNEDEIGSGFDDLNFN